MGNPRTHPEHAPPPLASHGLAASVAAITHPGMVRPHNEDAVLVGTWSSQDRLDTPWMSLIALQTPLVCVVADGLGGHGGGAAASALAVESLRRQQHQFGRGESAIRTELLAIHQRLCSVIERRPGQSAPGTIVAGLVLEQGRGWVFNVGDSRVYRFRDGFLTQLSTDDVPDPSYGDSGEPRTSHRITQCLGVFSEPPEPHIHRLTPADGDLFLLCSDGLTEMLNLDTLEAVLAAGAPRDLGGTVANLAAAALTAGGFDNISIILARIETRGAELH